jgi:hypothetical protein
MCKWCHKRVQLDDLRIWTDWVWKNFYDVRTALGRHEYRNTKYSWASGLELRWVLPRPRAVWDYSSCNWTAVSIPLSDVRDGQASRVQQQIRRPSLCGLLFLLVDLQRKALRSTARQKTRQTLSHQRRQICGYFCRRPVRVRCLESQRLLQAAQTRWIV